MGVEFPKKRYLVPKPSQSMSAFRPPPCRGRRLETARSSSKHVRPSKRSGSPRGRCFDDLRYMMERVGFSGRFFFGLIVSIFYGAFRIARWTNSSIFRPPCMCVYLLACVPFCLANLTAFASRLQGKSHHPSDLVFNRVARSSQFRFYFRGWMIT